MCALAICDVLSSNFDFSVYEYYTDAQWTKIPPDDHVLCDRNLVDTGVWAMQSLMTMYIKVQKYVSSVQCKCLVNILYSESSSAAMPVRMREFIPMC